MSRRVHEVHQQLASPNPSMPLSALRGFQAEPCTANPSSSAIKHQNRQTDFAHLRRDGRGGAGRRHLNGADAAGQRGKGCGRRRRELGVPSRWRPGHWPQAAAGIDRVACPRRLLCDCRARRQHAGVFSLTAALWVFYSEISQWGSQQPQCLSLAAFLLRSPILLQCTLAVLDHFLHEWEGKPPQTIASRTCRGAAAALP